jgi:hypothetical protein
MKKLPQASHVKQGAKKVKDVNSKDLQENSIDRGSFILGMMTAFAECLANECKKMAFSPPFYPEDYEPIRAEAEKIAQEQGIHLWYEANPDLPEDNKVHWLVMYKFPEVLDEYKALREKGQNPYTDLDVFGGILSYGTVWGKNADNVMPQMRDIREIKDTVSRILL